MKPLAGCSVLWRTVARQFGVRYRRRKPSILHLLSPALPTATARSGASP